MMKKIGIVGSRKYKDMDKIIRVVEEAIERFGEENICIVSGGCPTGADRIAKEIALTSNIKYEEYNPSHSSWNQYSVYPEEWFGKKYKIKNFFERNTFIAEASDYIVAFIPNGVKADGTKDTISKAKKLNKPVWIME